MSAVSESDKWPENVNFGTIDFTSHEFESKYHGSYDAIYLDMLNLEKAMPIAHKLLKKNGVLVVNAMHLTQCLSCLSAIRKLNLGLYRELVLEPCNRIWELNSTQNHRRFSGDEAVDPSPSDLDWTCRLEDRFDEKNKRGGLFFNYWQGFLMKFRKTD